MHTHDYARLKAFIAVAEYRNFKRAAGQLRISPSTLSQTIRALEESLGVRLLNRTTRSVAVTQAGLQLLGQLRPALRAIDRALDEASSFTSQAAGPLRVSVSREAARLVVAPLVGQFVEQYPDIQLELSIDDTVTDIVREGYDAGIRTGHLLEKDMIATRLTDDLPMRLVAAPTYLERRGRPGTPAELRDHNCICTSHATSGAVFHWAFTSAGRHSEIIPRGTPVVNDQTIAVSAALAGAGICYVLAADVDRYIDAGELVSLLQEQVPALPGFYLYHPANRHRPGALRALLEFMKARGAPMSAQADGIALRS